MPEIVEHLLEGDAFGLEAPVEGLPAEAELARDPLDADVAAVEQRLQLLLNLAPEGGLPTSRTRLKGFPKLGEETEERSGIEAARLRRRGGAGEGEGFLPVPGCTGLLMIACRAGAAPGSPDSTLDHFFESHGHAPGVALT